jgi:hypothetical protein
MVHPVNLVLINHDRPSIESDRGRTGFPDLPSIGRKAILGCMDVDGVPMTVVKSDEQSQ